MFISVSTREQPIVTILFKEGITIIRIRSVAYSTRFIMIHTIILKDFGRYYKRWVQYYYIDALTFIFFTYTLYTHIIIFIFLLRSITFDVKLWVVYQKISSDREIIVSALNNNFLNIYFMINHPNNIDHLNTGDYDKLKKNCFAILIQLIFLQ